MRAYAAFSLLQIQIQGFQKKSLRSVLAQDLYCSSSATRLNCFDPLSAGMEDKSGLTEHEWDLEFHG